MQRTGCSPLTLALSPLRQCVEAASPASDRWAKRACWTIVAVGLAAAAMIVGDFGAGWDESVQARYGELVADYFLSGCKDTSCNEYLDLKIYGPTVDLAAAMLYRSAPQYKMLVRHGLTAVLALLTTPALFRFGRLLGNPWIGVLGAVSLLMTPQFVGHAFINSKDIPFACLFAWSMWAITSLLARGKGEGPLLPQKGSVPFSAGGAIGCGLLIGLTASVRPGGWVLLTLLFVAATIFVDFVGGAAERGSEGRGGGENWLSFSSSPGSS